MASRARETLRLLEPCLAVREAQLQIERIEVRAARQLADLAQDQLDQAQTHQQAISSALGNRVAGLTPFGAGELRTWQAAAAAACQAVQTKEQHASQAEQRFAGNAEQLARTDASCASLSKTVKQASKQAKRDDEKRALNSMEDLLAARRRVK